MKQLIIVFLNLLSLACQGQLFNVSSDQNNVLYAGVENPLTITVQNVSSKKVIAQTDNGKLIGQSGHYTFYTDTGEVANITLFKKRANKIIKIGVAVFHVRQIPDPRVRLGSYMGGDIPSVYLKSQPGITTDIASIYYRKGLPIVSFTLNILRNNEYVFKEIKNEGGLFNEEVQLALSKTLPGDSVIFNNILARRNDSSITILSPMTFNIRN